MYDRSLAGAVARAGLALVLALIAATVIRGITADLSNSIGRAWPFSLVHCRAQSTPGCDSTEAARYVATRYVAGVRR